MWIVTAECPVDLVTTGQNSAIKVESDPRQIQLFDFFEDLVEICFSFVILNARFTGLEIDDDFFYPRPIALLARKKE